jgi:hypothetical protein
MLPIHLKGDFESLGKRFFRKLITTDILAVASESTAFFPPTCLVLHSPSHKLTIDEFVIKPFNSLLRFLSVLSWQTCRIIRRCRCLAKRRDSMILLEL